MQSMDKFEKRLFVLVSAQKVVLNRPACRRVSAKWFALTVPRFAAVGQSLAQPTALELGCGRQNLEIELSSTILTSDRFQVRADVEQYTVNLTSPEFLDLVQSVAHITKNAI